MDLQPGKARKRRGPSAEYSYMYSEGGSPNSHRAKCGSGAWFLPPCRSQEIAVSSDPVSEPEEVEELPGSAAAMNKVLSFVKDHAQIVCV